MRPHSIPYHACWRVQVPGSIRPRRRVVSFARLRRLICLEIAARLLGAWFICHLKFRSLQGSCNSRSSHYDHDGLPFSFHSARQRQISVPPLLTSQPMANFSSLHRLPADSLSPIRYNCNHWGRGCVRLSCDGPTRR